MAARAVYAASRLGPICTWQSIVAAAVQRVQRCMLAVVAFIITDNHGAQAHTVSTSSTLYNCRRCALCVDQVSTGAGSASSRPQLGVEYTVCLHRHQSHVVVSFVQLGLSLRMKASACHGCTVCVLCTHQLGRTWHLQQIMAAPSHAESVNLIAAVECICSSFGRAERISVPEGHGRRGLEFRRWRKA